MKNFFLLFVFVFTITTYSQSVSEYKYIVMPQKFGFLKKPNQYNLNSLTKSVLEQQGYSVYYEDGVLPQDLAENRCKALYADMLENNTLFSTKIKLELKDCKNQVVFISEEGTSREKEFEKAYIQAFRGVGKSLQTIKSKPKQEFKEVVATPAKAPAEQMQEVPVKAAVEANNATVVQQLFAQPIANGFQLVDSSPKVVMKLFKTSASNFYIGQKDTAQGVVFNKNNQWIFEYYQNDKLVSEKLEIKF
ncbi:hypothetical protein ABGT15_08720 [Flavobacterium enshiense]|uniref:hypothetical protein n=1 Tax=Flavobacterium enshiense TaxID=1341165 RepID=UPI00345D4829